MTRNWKWICDDFFGIDTGEFNVQGLVHCVTNDWEIFNDLWQCAFEYPGKIVSDERVVTKDEALIMLVKLALSGDSYCRVLLETREGGVRSLHDAAVNSDDSSLHEDADDLYYAFLSHKRNADEGSVASDTMTTVLPPERIRARSDSPGASSKQPVSPPAKKLQTSAGRQEPPPTTSGAGCGRVLRISEVGKERGSACASFEERLSRIEDILFAAAMQNDSTKLRTYLTILNPREKAKDKPVDQESVEEFHELLPTLYFSNDTARDRELFVGKYEATCWFAATLVLRFTRPSAARPNRTQLSLRDLARRLAPGAWSVLALPARAHPASKNRGAMRAYERILEQAEQVQLAANNTASVIGDIVECFDTTLTLSSPDPQLMGADTAAKNLAALLTDGFPHQSATNAQAVATFAEAWAARNGGGTPLLGLFRLVTLLEGQAREAAAHVFLILQDYLQERSAELSQVADALTADARLHGFLQTGFVAPASPWMLELGLRLRGALGGRPVPEVRLAEDRHLASLQDDRAFLLAATLRHLGEPLSQAASTALVSRAQGGGAGSLLFSELDALSHFTQMREIMARLATVLDQGSVDQGQDVAGRAELLKVLLLYWTAEGPTHKEQGVALMAGIWLMACNMSLEHQHVKVAEQEAPEGKLITDVLRGYLKMSVAAELLDKDVEAWSVELVKALMGSQYPTYSMSTVVAAAACLCLARPSCNGVRLALELALRVLNYLSDYPQLRREEAMAHTAVVEAVLGLLTGGWLKLPVPARQAIQVLRGMPGLVRALQPYPVFEQVPGMRGAAAAWEVLQRLGIESGFL